MIPIVFAKFKDAIHIGGTTRLYVDLRRPECKLMTMEFDQENRILVVSGLVSEKKIRKTVYVPAENLVVFERPDTDRKNDTVSQQPVDNSFTNDAVMEAPKLGNLDKPSGKRMGRPPRVKEVANLDKPSGAELVA